MSSYRLLALLALPGCLILAWPEGPVDTADDPTQESTPVDSEATSTEPVETAGVETETSGSDTAEPLATLSTHPESPTTIDDVELIITPTGEGPEPEVVQIRWVLGGVEVTSARDQWTLPALETARDDEWRVRATLRQGDTERIEQHSFTIVNALPQVTAVMISPSTPTTLDALTAIATAEDADGDPVSFRYTWFINDTEVGGVEGEHLDSDRFERDDVVRVRATPDDGFDEGEPGESAPVEIANSPPSAPGVRLTPEVLRHGEELRCEISAESVDPDPGDVVSYGFTWTKNGLPFLGAIHGGDGQSSVIRSTDVTKLSDWQCLATASDGEAESESASEVIRARLKVRERRLAALDHSMVVDGAGQIWAWGDNHDAQLGIGFRSDFGVAFPDPERVEMPEAMRSAGVAIVDASIGHSVAVDLTGRVWAWGNDLYGAVGIDSERFVDRPTEVTALADVEIVDIVCSQHANIALSSLGEIWVWGGNGLDDDESRGGRLGDGGTALRRLPHRLSALDKIERIGSGGNSWYTYVADVDGQAYGWGLELSSWPALPGLDVRGSVSPLRLPALDHFGSISTAQWWALTLDRSGSVAAWGVNESGQVGVDPDSSDIEEAPRLIDALPPNVRAHAGHTTGIAISAEGAVWTWGSNSGGLLGRGLTDRDLSYDPEPAAITLPGHALEVAVANNQALVLTETGNLYAWGRNWSGQVGDGTTEERTAPVLIGSFEGPFEPTP